MMDQFVNIDKPNENKGFNTLCSKNAEYGPASSIYVSDLLFQTAMLKKKFCIFFSDKVLLCNSN